MRPIRANKFPFHLARRLAVMAVFPAVWLSVGGAHACEDQAVKRLAALGVGASAIKEVEVHRETMTQEDGLLGYKAWVRLDGCKGYAVIDLDTRCRPYQEYTTRDCRIPGVSNY